MLAQAARGAFAIALQNSPTAPIVSQMLAIRCTQHVLAPSPLALPGVRAPATCSAPPRCDVYSDIFRIAEFKVLFG
jgi:hypothetical protein